MATPNFPLLWVGILARIYCLVTAVSICMGMCIFVFALCRRAEFADVRVCIYSVSF